MNAHPPKILFLCRRNSCRSQMAEGWCRALHSEKFEPFSAGIERGPIDARAATVMAEAGIDISAHVTKSVDELKSKAFDYVISVCDISASDCPIFPGSGKRIAQPFDDPPRLASSESTEEEKLKHYRRVRDEIRSFVEKLPFLLS